MCLVVRARVIYTKAPVNGKVSILLFMFCCCFKEPTRLRRQDEKNNSGHDSSSLLLARSLSVSVSLSFSRSTFVVYIYIIYICYSHVVMPLYTQIRGGRATASERGSCNIIISKTVEAAVYIYIRG